MQHTIWKYRLEITDRQEIKMPAGARILSLQVQGGEPCIWVQVDADQAAMEIRRLVMFGTGHPLPAELMQFIGTFQTDVYVFHLFEGL